MSDEVDTDTIRYTCPECQAGLMHLENIAYFTWLAGELITVPDFPAWICDVCGRREYDRQAVSRLNIMLNSGTGHPARRPTRRKLLPPDQPPAQP
jgi:YgiT-type zinc finger domain-containing protein